VPGVSQSNNKAVSARMQEQAELQECRDMLATSEQLVQFLFIRARLLEQQLHTLGALPPPARAAAALFTDARLTPRATTHVSCGCGQGYPWWKERV